MHPTSISRIYQRETCIGDVLSLYYLTCLQSELEWKQISEGFNRKWNFPHCQGAIDGTHVVMQTPVKFGSSFFNDKKTFTRLINCLWHSPPDVFIFKVNNRNTRTRCEICSKLTLKTPDRRQWRRSDVSIVNFEHILQLILVFLLATLTR